MKINLLTIAVFVISLYLLRSTLRRFRHDEIGLPTLLIWITLWSSIGICALFPAITEYFINLVDVGRRIVFALLVAVLILFSLVYHLSFKIEHLRRNMITLTQELALLRSTSRHTGQNTEAHAQKEHT